MRISVEDLVRLHSSTTFCHGAEVLGGVTRRAGCRGRCKSSSSVGSIVCNREGASTHCKGAYSNPSANSCSRKGCHGCGLSCGGVDIARSSFHCGSSSRRGFGSTCRGATSLTWH